MLSCAAGGVSGTLHLQSAIAGGDIAQRACFCRAALGKWRLMFGSYATELHEPCQVRNEAALSGIFRVRKGAWAELTTKVTSVKARSKRNAHNKIN